MHPVCFKVFPDLDFLGWYGASDNGTGDNKPTDADVAVHRQICEIHESPLFLRLNTSTRKASTATSVSAASSADHLPVAMYESIVDLVGGEARMFFVKLKYTLTTAEAERIGLDHVAKISSSSSATKASSKTDSGPSKVSEHAMAQLSAVKMLAGRVRLILDYVRAMEAGEVRFDHAILREAKALADRLPVLEISRFRPEFFTQCNDAALLTYLGAVMKSCNNLNQFINKFNVLYQRQGSGRRMRAIFF